MQDKTKSKILSDLGEMILLDRYALKDMTRKSLKIGDRVVVLLKDSHNAMQQQREIGTVTEIDNTNPGSEVTVVLRNGETVETIVDYIDKPLELTPEEIWRRLASAAADNESVNLQEPMKENFYKILEDFKFVPGGRIMSAIGTDQNLTSFNCYVLPMIPDSRLGIMESLTNMAEIMARGGGVGINVSGLRPRHSYVAGVNGRSSGAVSWANLFSTVTGLIEQAGSRRGALMVMLNDWHPDVLDYIKSKREKDAVDTETIPSDIRESILKVADGNTRKAMPALISIANELNKNRATGFLTNANISVGFSDAFMEALANDDKWELKFPDTQHKDYDDIWNGNIEEWEAAGLPVIVYKTIQAKELWDAVTESAWASAEPGLWFRDRTNDMSNSRYYDTGYIVGTNPCVTGDTRIYTDKGMIPAVELFDDETSFNVVTDSRFGTDTFQASSRMFLTGTRDIYKLSTVEGYEIRLTDDHRVMTERGWVEARELITGDKIHIANRGGGFGSEGNLEMGRIIGWLAGDGTNNGERTTLSFFGSEKEELVPLFTSYVNRAAGGISQHKYRKNYTVTPDVIAERDEARVTSKRLQSLIREFGLVDNKHQVPEVVFRGTREMQAGYLQGLFTADGSVQGTTEKGISVRLSQSSLELLTQVQQLLLNFGIASRIYKNRRDAGYRSLPDGKGGHAEYWCKAQHELVISKTNLFDFRDRIGFLTSAKNNALDTALNSYKRQPNNELFYATFEKLEFDGTEEVFDLTQPTTHSFVANGLVVHNCGEQGLPGFGVCNLGAVNLGKFVDDEGNILYNDIRETAYHAARFLDNVIDIAYYPLPESEKQQKSERRVGLGIMGLAEMLVRAGVRYGSEEAAKVTEEVFEVMAEAAYLSSIDSAKDKGSFEKFNAEEFVKSGYVRQLPEHIREEIRNNGIRNVTLLTVAPTGSTGTMVGTSTGIEPYFSWKYYRRGRLGVHEENVNLVQEFLDRNPEYTFETLPDYFVTAMELTPEEHVRMQAAAQKWVDSSISKTINAPNDYTVEQVDTLYRELYSSGCKGGTIYRDGSRSIQVLSLNTDDNEDYKDETTEIKEATDRTPLTFAKRTNRLTGETVSGKTPFGTVFVTINEQNGEPFEVFINIGKSGSDVRSFAEALGRSWSRAIQSQSGDNRMKMLEELAAQSLGIGGSRSVGFGPNRTNSIPDAVAKVVMRYIYNKNGAAENEEVMKLSDFEAEQSSKIKIKGANICPDCSHISLIDADGCRKCLVCGYSEC